MGAIAPGWYEDDEDERLARWWDGAAWTRHTVVIADQVTGEEPPPPTGAWTRFPVPTPPPDEGAWAEEDEWADDDLPYLDPHEDEAIRPIEPPAAWPPVREQDDWDTYGTFGLPRFQRPRDEQTADRTRRAGAPGSLADRVRDLPTWARVAAPVLAVLIAVGAVASAGALRSDDSVDGGNITDITEPDPVRLRDAADLALAAAGVEWFTTQGFLASIPPTCAAAAERDPQRVADRVLLLGYDDATVGHLVDGLEAGVRSYCPQDVEGYPTFFDEVYLATGADPAATSTTTTVFAPLAAAQEPDPAASSTSTTKRTNTTARPAAPGPTQPAPTAPPDTTPPTEPPTTTSTSCPEPCFSELTQP